MRTVARLENNPRRFKEFKDFITDFVENVRRLRESANKARGNRKEIIKMIEVALQQGLQQAGIEAEALVGREKHLYSIYKKMRKKSLTFSEIMDFYAFRVILDSVDTSILCITLDAPNKLQHTMPASTFS